jgi:hypothetical protein
MIVRFVTLALVASLVPACATVAQDAPPPPATTATTATTQKVGHFPFLEVDARSRQVKVECEALRCENPLEFFLCVTGTNEYESVLRSKVRPSHLHAALLMLGLQPGEPVHYSEAMQKWLPPHGPPLMLSVSFEEDGKTVTWPAWALMREIRTKRPMPATTWIFAGSRVMDNGVYAADRTGYLVSIVNFDLTVIDTPKLASNANETLEWEINPKVVPPTGTKVTLLIEPAGKDAYPPATQEIVPGGPVVTGVDLPLISIDAAGKIALNGAPVERASQLPEMLKKVASGERRIRVAIANTIEDNPAARDVINVLSAERLPFVTMPQADQWMRQATRPSFTAPEVAADDQLIQRLREKWNQAVAPRGEAVRDAAKAHYEVISQLRREQQRLIDEADKIQRLIDQLEKKYQDMTTPSPQ